MSYPTSPVDGQIFGNKKYNSIKNAWISFVAPAIGSVYFQGSNDAAPAILYPGTIWEDVSWEETNCTRRVAGSLSGSRFTGVPAKLSVSVTSGVPTISIISGGSGYTNGTLNLIITGTCTTQMIATATVTSGSITAIVVGTAGAGYTSGSVAVYDGVSGHGDLAQKHRHASNNSLWGYVGSGGNAGTGSGSNTAGSTIVEQLSAPGYGSVRAGAENSGAWVTVIKWRRTA